MNRLEVSLKIILLVFHRAVSTQEDVTTELNRKWATARAKRLRNESLTSYENLESQ